MLQYGFQSLQQNMWVFKQFSRVQFTRLMSSFIYRRDIRVETLDTDPVFPKDQSYDTKDLERGGLSRKKKYDA